MRKINRSLRGALTTVVAAVTMAVLALTLMPTAALAEPTQVAGTGKVAISGLTGTETIELYKVADTLADDETNALSYEWKDAFKDIDGLPTLPSTTALTQAQANQIATKVTSAMKVNATPAIANGTATVSDLPAGLYYVKVTDGNDSTRVFQNIVVPVNPKDSNGNFVYDEEDDFGTTEQEIKVQSTSLTKTVKDGNVADSAYGETINTLSTGDTASFKLDVAVPFYNTDVLSKTGATNAVTFSIVDTLDTTYIKTPTNVAVSADGVTLAKDTDYRMATTDGTLTVTFTPTGLTKLNSSEPSANTKAVTITYDATVVATAGTTGLVDINNAVLTFSKSSADPTKTNTTSDKVQAQFYSLTVQKYGSDTGDSLLAGAEFALSGQNLSPSATSTDTNGTYTFPVALGSGDAFTLSETTAPTGYLKVADQTVTVEDGNATVTITDQKDNASILPSTGGAGTIGLTVAGVAIMAGAAAFVIRSRKQND